MGICCGKEKQENNEPKKEKVYNYNLSKNGMNHERIADEPENSKKNINNNDNNNNINKNNDTNFKNGSKNNINEKNANNTLANQNIKNDENINNNIDNKIPKLIIYNPNELGNSTNSRISNDSQKELINNDSENTTQIINPKISFLYNLNFIWIWQNNIPSKILDEEDKNKSPKDKRGILNSAPSTITNIHESCNYEDNKPRTTLNSRYKFPIMQNYENKKDPIINSKGNITIHSSISQSSADPQPKPEEVIISQQKFYSVNPQY